MTHMKDSRISAEHKALIAEVKSLLTHIPNTEYMTHYDGFITFKQRWEGKDEVYCLLFEDIPNFLEVLRDDGWSDRPVSV